MARIDPKKLNQLRDEIQKHIREGNLAKAIELSEQFLKFVPDDLKILQQLSGLYQRVGKIKEAVDIYIRLGENRAKGGFYQQAVASYKQALKLNPNLSHVHEEISRILLMIGIKAEGLEHLLQAVRLYRQEGQLEKAEKALKTALEIDKDNYTYRAEYAELLYQMGKHEEAARIFKGLAEILKIEQKNDELLKFYNRILKVHPEDKETAKELARLYIQMNLPPRALQVLQTLFNQGHVDADLYELVGRAYVLLGKPDRAVHAWLEKTKYLDPLTQKEDLLKTYRRILEQDPTNETALKAIAELEGSPEEMEVGGKGEEIEIVEIEEPPPEPSKRKEIPPQDEFQPLLNEASVFLRFGVEDKALATLNRILQKNPDHIPALEKRAEILKKHDPNKAIRDLIHLAEIHESLGQQEKAEKFIEKAKQINPNHPALKAFLGEVVVDLEKELTQVAEEALTEEKEEVVDLELEEAVEQEVISPPAHTEPFHKEEETNNDIMASVLEEELKGIFEEEEVPSSPPSAPPLEEKSEIDLEIEQLQFFLDTGLEEEALRLFHDLKNRLGDHPRLRPFERKLAQVIPKQSVEEPSQTFDIQDLVKDIGEELNFLEVSPGTEDAPPFEEMFSQFKKGVKEVLGEDPNAHYDLGIAYLEMGLIDDAYQEFELASRSEEKFVDALQMMAECHKRKGEYELAIQPLEKALTAPSLTEEALLNIHYELGLLYGDLNQFKKALEHFKVVVDKNKEFRQIKEEILRLKNRIAQWKKQ